MTKRQSIPPADWQERQKALDISTSCIVQAPAGSGKTELLVQRILALLAVAENPEEVISITFTRKAAGEMKLRLLQALERALEDRPPTEEHAAETWQRARSVLDRDRAKDWGLLQNPSRLQLTTIDSFCAFLTRRMPWLSRLGDQPRVTDDPAELYLSAAESLLARLEKGGAGQSAVEHLLSHLDNRLPLLRDLLVAMLGRRDQWLRHLMARRDQDPREILESSLQDYVDSFLHKTHVLLGEEAYCELIELAGYAAGNLPEDHIFNSVSLEKNDQGSLDQWLVLVQLVLTSAGDVRKNVTKTLGFPADKTALAREKKSQIQALLDALRGTPVVSSLQMVRRLPATRYDSGQWRILKALIELLPLAVVELKEVFRSQGQVDFIEIAGAAYEALGSETAPEELLLQLDGRIRHILVDEFQDTSYAQYNLLTRLIAGWESGDGRTLFVVGDPMQSIYRFREAEVGLYLRVCQRGLNGWPMDRVVLNTNFRSKTNLVEWVNAKFSGLFPATAEEVRGAVPFAPSRAYKDGSPEPAVTFHAFTERQDAAEAEKIVELIRQDRANCPDGTIAVLVRSRSHLVEIVKALKKAGLNYQAQDVDPLIDRPVVQDLLSLARAIQHPADRVAWLSLLRAPWCGLTLEDLHSLCGKDTRSTIWQLLTRPVAQTEMFEQISPHGEQRLSRIIPALERALKNRGRLSLRRLVESTWLALNGPACIEEADLADVRQVFDLLENFEIDGSLEVLERQLGKLFAAPDPQAGAELQLMTIHKAKGLEFDTVIVPGLGRGVRSRDRDLLRWLEHPDYGLLLAPVPPLLSEQTDPTYQAIGHILKDKDDFETLRLLYVAATRARSNLHLLGHAKISSEGELSPLPGSLLSVIWPVCRSEFCENVRDFEEQETVEHGISSLKRLPLQWRPAPLAESLVASTTTVQIASGTGHYLDAEIKSRRTEEGRVIGVIVHAWLERIATDGLFRWTATAIAEQDDNIKAQLNLQGVPLARLDSCAATILSCLSTAIESNRGRWLLDSHPGSACELALNGVVDGQMVHAIIDRTFLDEAGARWIVDYKTSNPDADEPAEHFISAELDRYQKQMQLYAALSGQLEPGRPLRAALYFPRFDGWIEVSSKTTDRSATLTID